MENKDIVRTISGILLGVVFALLLTNLFRIRNERDQAQFDLNFVETKQRQWMEKHCPAMLKR